MRHFKRANRLAEQILRDLSRLMEKELAGLGAGMVTLTHVKLSDDLRHAKVYYSVLGRENDRNIIANYLEREKKHIRHILGSQLHLRHIPEFTFKYDPSIEEGIRIEQLLNEIKSNTKK
ncbi:MAG: 30S ribosome-binding factor RbfA [Candidatus Zixiibacteriota bacterium]